VNRSIARTDLYNAVHFAWKISPRKANQADVVLATQQGMIVGAFIADQWLPATSKNFPGREDGAAGRYGFIGEEAPPEIWELYVGKSVPASFRKPGAANPIKYSWSKGNFGSASKAPRKKRS
jgi:hypothetical protein